METSYSVGRVILLTYLFLLSPYASNLFSNTLKRDIENSRLAQHIILLILIITLVMMFGNPVNYEVSKNEILNSVVMGLIIYIFFILTTKLNCMYNISIIVILITYFLYESHKITEYKSVINDENLENNEKIKIISNYDNTKNYILAGIFGVTVIGSALYYDEKYNKITQMGGSGKNNFTLEKFWFN